MSLIVFEALFSPFFMKKQKKSKFYRLSLMIMSLIVIVGIILELILSQISSEIIFPLNVIIALLFILFIGITYLLIPNSSIIKLMVSVENTLVLIAFVLLMTIYMGVIPQDLNHGGDIINLLGLNRITTTWTFLLLFSYLELSLGYIIAKRVSVLIKQKYPFDIHQFSFLLNHIGLFFLLLVGILGANDIKHFTIKLYPGQENNIIYDKNGNGFELDFGIKLDEFSVENYKPKLGILSNKTGELTSLGDKQLIQIEDDLSFEFNDYKIKLENFIELSSPFGDNYVKVYQYGSIPSAEFSIIKDGKALNRSWITCGNFMHQYRSLKIDDDHSLVMTIPEVKKFTSHITLIDGNESLKETIEVNKPFDFKGFKIYQLAYDDKKGKWSEYSILELVYDPWLTWVYVSMILLSIGSVMLVYSGIKSKNN